MNHALLALHAKEMLMCGHLIDRAAMPYVIAEFGREVMEQVAIDEWMGASPIYTKRMQQLLGFDGDSVETIFKGMQFDIGAPPEFMDFRYTVHDHDHGEFQLAHCGALMDVEPMGDEFVHGMCHTIEDPTFDATAAAVNPRAQVRPVHRPPRIPADRQPHCAWTVVIDGATEPVQTPDAVHQVRDSMLAVSDLAVIDRSDRSGRFDYSEPLRSDVDFEGLSASTLRALSAEAALQGHVLARSFMCALARRGDESAALRIGALQLVGAAGVAARRLRTSFDLDASLASLAEVLRLHPLLWPVSLAVCNVEVDGDTAMLKIHNAAELVERDGLSWWSLLWKSESSAAQQAFQAIAYEVNPLIEVTDVERDKDSLRVTFHLDETGKPVAESEPVLLASFSTGVEFRWSRR